MLALPLGLLNYSLLVLPLFLLFLAGIPGQKKKNPTGNENPGESVSPVDYPDLPNLTLVPGIGQQELDVRCVFPLSAWGTWACLSSGSAARRDSVCWLLLFELYHNKARQSLIRAGLSRKSAARTRSEECQLWVALDSVCLLGQLASSANKGGRIIVLISFTGMKLRLLKVVKCCEVEEIKLLKH